MMPIRTICGGAGRTAILLSALVAVAAATPLARQTTPLSPVPGSGGAWAVEGAERQGDVRIAPFLGRDAVWLKNNTHAIRTGEAFSDGTIEFDLAPMDRADFVAVVFRAESHQNHENVYLRIRQSGRFMALQYAPYINGSSTWQLYPEFNVATTWPRNQWTHVRVVVRGSILQVFVGDGTSPVLTVPRLRHDIANGHVAFWARVNNQPDQWAAAISNLRIQAAPPAARATQPEPPATYISRWEVTAPVPASADSLPHLPDGATWTAVKAEESGLVNLNSAFPVQRGRFTVFARTTITAESARRVLAGIGYSDDVVVFLNGAPLYSAVNGWESRGPEYASFVDARFESVWLPLKAGTNELALAVTDDQRFGWGFAVKLE